MVIYTKEEKTLIIPEGLGTGTGSCEGVYREGYNDGYQSGSTDGYAEGYADGQAADCGEAIAEAYESGYTEGYTQGQEDCPECSGGTCNLENGQVGLGIEWDGDDTIYPSQGYDGFSSFRIYDNGYGQALYDSGYTDGRESVTSGCPMQEKFINLSGIEESVSPDYGYAGLSEVHINAENFYNTAYNDGYSAGLNDCSGSTDCSSAITEAYDSGYTVGYGEGYTSGSTDGYDNGYMAGYAQGQADCPQCSGGTCNLEMKNYEIYASGEGVWLVEPDNGYDGISHLTIYDAGYGGKWYDTGLQEGFNSGYTSGYTDGHSSGYTEGYGAGYTIGSADGYNAGEQYGFQTGYQSGYTDGYNDAITANCGSAVTEAYESGVTEERGNIYAVKIKVTPTSQNWSWTQYGTPHKLTAADALGNNYVFNINYVIYDGYSWDEDAGQTYIDYEFLGRFETTGGTPVKYLTPAQLTIEVPSQDYNTWGSNIGIEVFFNGEMVPAQYEGNPIPPLAFDLENGFKYEAVSYSVGYNAEDSRCYQLIIDLQ